jgi:hypothetical protein
MKRCQTLCDACESELSGYHCHEAELVIANNLWWGPTKVNLHYCDDCISHATWDNTQIFATNHGRILGVNEGDDLRNIHHDETFRNIITGAAKRVRRELEYVREERDWEPPVRPDD